MPYHLRDLQKNRLQFFLKLGLKENKLAHRNKLLCIMVMIVLQSDSNDQSTHEPLKC